MSNQEYENTKKNVYITTSISLAILIIVAIVIFLKTSDIQKIDSSNTNNETKFQELTIENATSGNFNLNDGSELIVESDGYLHWYSAGSSTCPPIIESAEYTSKNTIELKEKTYSKVACTMDLRPVHQIIKNSDGTPFGDDVEATLEAPTHTIGINPAEK